MKGFFLLLSLLFSSYSSADVLFKKTVSIDGLVVASACRIEIDNGKDNSGIIDFGTYDKASGIDYIEKTFKVKVFENEAVEPGCSAFMAGTGVVSFNFGDGGQLDNNGVVTRGAGDGIRVLVSSTDVDAVSNSNPITINNPTLNYPVEFATKGVFGFNGKVLGLQKSKPGNYTGSLSLVVSYK